MKVVLLAGGLPSTIGEEDDKMPKPMVKIGERPLLWHIMKQYACYGFNEFVICAGYKSDIIKDYFLNYYIYRSDITVDLKNNEIEIHNEVTDDWKITILDTGINSTTADRIKQVINIVEGDFIIAYGDCISNINVKELVESHKSNNKNLTVSLAKPTGRNEIVPINNGNILKKGTAEYTMSDAWANACTMVTNKNIIKYINNDNDRFEIETLQKVLNKEQVNIYKHGGFWLPVETIRDKNKLQKLWDTNNAPWKIWND